MTTHPIQTHILKQLIAHPNGLRYRDMKPAETENDLYNYHLQYLVKQELLTKQTDIYELSDIGKKYILEVKPIDILGSVTDKFKLAALCLVTRRGTNGLELLYQTRSLQPFAGNRELIGGSVYKGELIVEAATRRLNEEAGLTANFKLFGLLRKIRFDSQEDLYSDILYHICLAYRFDGEFIKQNQFGAKEWLTLEEAIQHERNAPYGSQQFATVLESLKTTNPENIPLFYFEETTSQDIY